MNGEGIRRLTRRIVKGREGGAEGRVEDRKRGEEGEELPHLRSTLQSEMELSNLDWAPNTRERQQRKLDSRSSSATRTNSSPASNSNAKSTERTMVESEGVDDPQEGKRRRRLGSG